METVERFLQPIPGDKPGGVNLRYVLHDKLREARRQEEAAPMGQWERETKVSDYKAVIKLAEDALLKSSKDLWIAAWLTEAWIYEYDLPGLTSGLQLIQGLLENFWPVLYPEPEEDGDLELRASPLEWLGSYFDPGKGSSPIVALNKIPLTEGGLHRFHYQESRRIGSEADVRGNDARTKARDLAVKEGKLTPEAFDKDFAATPKIFYKDLERESKVVLETLNKLDGTCKELFAGSAPSFGPLREAVLGFGNVVHILLIRKLEKEPDAPEPTAPATVLEPARQEAPAAPPSAAFVPNASIASELRAGEIASYDDAVLNVVAAARYLLRNDPSHPGAYLLLRALRWSELRNQTPDAGKLILPAPSPETRIALKNAALAENYQQVLAVAESAMSTDVGRGWLDLHRYVIVACDKLKYVTVAKALRSELKAFLQEFPQLHTATMTDDTGTANPETLAWLRAEGLIT